jgi:hypothetical protein
MITLRGVPKYETAKLLNHLKSTFGADTEMILEMSVAKSDGSIGAVTVYTPEPLSIMEQDLITQCTTTKFNIDHVEFIVTSKKGIKYDDGKLQWSLVPWDALQGCVRVLEEGAKKYAPDNWKTVPDGRKRYKDALLRHMLAYCGGETTDEEFGASHLDHAMCNLLFLKWLDMHDESRS